MNGHQPIIAMRRAGRKPAHVWVSDFADAPMAEHPGDHQTVRVAGDTPELLDLRFLIGATVIVEGANADRVGRIHRACVDARAARVISSVIESRPHGLHAVASVTDSEGLMTWPL